MARRKARKPPRPKPKTQAQIRDDVVQDTAATFTCSARVLDDFLGQCASRRDQLECDLVFNKVAHEIWRDRPEANQDIAAILGTFAAERERHLAALLEIEARLTVLSQAHAAQEHQHLDPVEPYRDLIRQRAFADDQ